MFGASFGPGGPELRLFGSDLGSIWSKFESRTESPVPVSRHFAHVARELRGTDVWYSNAEKSMEKTTSLFF